MSLTFYICKSTCKAPGPLWKVYFPSPQDFVSAYFLLCGFMELYLLLQATLKTEVFLQAPFCLLSMATPKNCQETCSWMWYIFVESLQHQRWSSVDGRMALSLGVLV